MIDLFVLLTPIFLLGIVALLGFVGCDRLLGLSQITAPPTLTISPASGPSAGGTLVTITASAEGTFDSNIFVTFGSAQPVPGSYVFTSDYAQATATTPPQLVGAVDVTVTYDDPSGQSGSITQSGAFTYNVGTPVVPLQAVIANQPASGNNQAQAKASLSEFGTPNKLVVVTVQWGGEGSLTLSPPFDQDQQQVELDDFSGPKGQVATYYAFVDLSEGLTVTATVTSSPETDLSLLVSAYDNVDPVKPTFPAQQQSNFASQPTLQFQTSTLALGDLIYAVAAEREDSGVSAGKWVPGAGFTASAGAGTSIMLEYYVLRQTDITAGNVNVTATDATAPNTNYWYLFAMAIKQA
jgi:hypothetical protein